ncbi:hypothetical protein [Agromyces sp. S2-1-8]|uniref:hypothetical protein n=1 Tax=Agromyces sp. S2-1-8 TaxID=2897180 RepID=UPI001E654948|nr:hypothetical protein [Agromyces sp. S2-1-8]MCD5348448.1 hypothetical protein [Agromyces sp. S2-1-8]
MSAPNGFVFFATVAFLQFTISALLLLPSHIFGWLIMDAVVTGALAAIMVGMVRRSYRWPWLWGVGLLVLLGTSAFWVGAEYFSLPTVGRNEGMTLAVLAWLRTVLVGTCVAVERERIQSQARSRERGSPRGSMLVVLGVCLPFVLQGVEQATKPRPMTVRAISSCRGETEPGAIPGLMALQWQISEGAADFDWDETVEVISIEQGQGRDEIEVPAILRENEWIKRRYMLPGAYAASPPPVQKFEGEYWNAWTVALTLGSRSAIEVLDTPITVEYDRCAIADSFE